MEPYLVFITTLTLLVTVILITATIVGIVANHRARNYWRERLTNSPPQTIEDMANFNMPMSIYTFDPIVRQLLDQAFKEFESKLKDDQDGETH